MDFFDKTGRSLVYGNRGGLALNGWGNTNLGGLKTYFTIGKVSSIDRINGSRDLIIKVKDQNGRLFFQGRMINDKLILPITVIDNFNNKKLYGKSKFETVLWLDNVTVSSAQKANFYEQIGSSVNFSTSCIKKVIKIGDIVGLLGHYDDVGGKYRMDEDQIIYLSKIVLRRNYSIQAVKEECNRN